VAPPVILKLMLLLVLYWADRKAFEYVTRKGVCQKCSLRAQCTQSENGGRTLKRHERQALLDRLRAQAQGAAARRDIRIRQHFMEGSFARATRLGLKRARWRGQWRVQIQDYLIAIVQNIELLIAHARPTPGVALAWEISPRNLCWLQENSELGTF
jgi:DDE family transposase